MGQNGAGEDSGPPGMGRGPGPVRGRGRGTGPHPPDRRTHAFKDAHKAAIGNHHRKDRALRKAGGPAT